jgi:hypothetical protein
MCFSVIASRHDAAGVAWKRFRRETFVHGPLRHVLHVLPVVCASTPPLDHLGVGAIATGVDIVYRPSTDSLGR